MPAIECIDIGDIVIPIIEEWKIIGYLHKSASFILQPMNTYGSFGRITVPIMWLGYKTTYDLEIEGSVEPMYSNDRWSYYTVMRSGNKYDVRVNESSFLQDGMYYIQKQPLLNHWEIEFAKRTRAKSEYQDAHHAIGTKVHRSQMTAHVVRIFHEDRNKNKVTDYECTWDKPNANLTFTLSNDAHYCWADLSKSLFRKVYKN